MYRESPANGIERSKVYVSENYHGMKTTAKSGSGAWGEKARTCKKPMKEVQEAFEKDAEANGGETLLGYCRYWSSVQDGSSTRNQNSKNLPLPLDTECRLLYCSSLL